jgi:uncharacterized protein (TIGR02118 family)
MIKRTSILVRRPQDDRAAFTAHWSGTHGGLVAALPDISRYTQNHVIEVYPVQCDGVAGYDIDGFVELYFASENAMRNAFTGERVKPIWDDEPNFLEHSTAYAITGDREPHPDLSRAKLIVVAAGSPGGIDWLAEVLGGLPIVPPLDRNDVSEVIARATMLRDPQPADSFIHLRFSSSEAAKAAAETLASKSFIDASMHGIRRIAIARVVEHRII